MNFQHLLITLSLVRMRFFQLPEVAFGLIPGAGGTASMLRRVGRSRFNYLALTGTRIDAETALQWRLIDDINDKLDA